MKHAVLIVPGFFHISELFPIQWKRAIFLLCQIQHIGNDMNGNIQTANHF